MSRKNILKTFLFVLGMSLLFPHRAKAVPPPDFIFSIGSSIAQVFSVIVIFCSGIFVFLYEGLKAKAMILKHRKLWLLLGSICIIALASAGSYFLAIQKQKNEYATWIIESQKNAEQQAKTEIPEIKEEVPIVIPTTTPETQNNFFETHKNTPLSISDVDFKAIINSNTQNFFILDAREDVEFENGHFPNATHIRMADLKSSEYQKLPTDKFVYVFCWSGIRGKEVAEFLRDKGVLGIYLENGANGWYTSGGDWLGSIKFTEKFTAPKFQKVFSTEEVQKYVSEGIVLVDSREPEKFKQSHIKGALNISMLFTPTANLETVFEQVPAHSKVIAICDDYVNCFDAKVTGVELEKRGQEFLGRYNTPWDYGN